MPKVVFEGQEYLAEAGETLLTCLTRHGVSIDHSCKAGICQTCLMVALKGEPPEAAQNGLKDALKTRNYFLPCVCIPQTDMEIARPDDNLISVETTVTSLLPNLTWNESIESMLITSTIRVFETDTSEFSAVIEPAYSVIMASSGTVTSTRMSLLSPASRLNWLSLKSSTRPSIPE